MRENHCVVGAPERLHDRRRIRTGARATILRELRLHSNRAGRSLVECATTTGACDPRGGQQPREPLPHREADGRSQPRGRGQSTSAIGRLRPHTWDRERSLADGSFVGSRRRAENLLADALGISANQGGGLVNRRDPALRRRRSDSWHRRRPMAPTGARRFEPLVGPGWCRSRVHGVGSESTDPGPGGRSAMSRLMARLCSAACRRPDELELQAEDEAALPLRGTPHTGSC